MKFSELIRSVGLSLPESCNDPDIKDLQCDSRRVTHGALFFALKGALSDGHKFIDTAVKNGAVAVIAEEHGSISDGIAGAYVEDARHVMALMASRFFGEPSRQTPLVGVTGTNGKTTTSHLIAGILDAAGIPAAILGTVGYGFGALKIPAPNTTPESIDLQRILKQLIDNGAKSAVMEVSSHALHQHRVDGCHFKVGVFTNLTRDHLDYHLTMEAYLAAKVRLFAEFLPESGGTAVINIDDAYGPEVLAASKVPFITFGINPSADVSIKDLTLSIDGIKGTFITPYGSFNGHSTLLGRFNVSNILAAVAAGVALKLPLEAIEKGIAQFRQVPGRMERIPNDLGITVVVDYAHTGDALENAIKTLAEVCKGRIITLFGCGGDRDKGKRPVMGEIAGSLSDLSIVTSDNPRTEEPDAIIADILKGLKGVGIEEYTASQLSESFDKKGFVVIPDRKEAIKKAINVAVSGDVVLIAGKGHEDYQITGTDKHHFDDREEALKALKER